MRTLFQMQPSSGLETIRRQTSTAGQCTKKVFHQHTLDLCSPSKNLAAPFSSQYAEVYASREATKPPRSSQTIWKRVGCAFVSAHLIPDLLNHMIHQIIAAVAREFFRQLHIRTMRSILFVSEPL